MADRRSIFGLEAPKRCIDGAHQSHRRAGALYDRVQAFDMQAAGVMAAFLLVLSLIALAVTYALSNRVTLRG